MRTFILLLTLAGCTAVVPVAPPPPPPEPPPVIVAPKAPGVSVAVVKKFDAASAREPGVVMDSRSADQINRVRAADKRARAALTRLGLQGRHPSKAVLGEARAAVKELEDAVSQ